VHGPDLLLSLGTCYTQNLVLLLNPRYFFLNLLFPVISFRLFLFATFSFEFSNLFNLCLFLNLKNCLLYCLCQKHIHNGLHLSVVIKKVIVFDLGDFVDTCFLRNVWRGGRFRNELIRLNLNIQFIRSLFTLLSEEISQVNLYPSWGSWPKIIG